MIRVPRPCIVSVRRCRPTCVSIGDVAEAQLDAGLIALLESPLGTGYHPRYNIPVGLASTAALAVLAPATTEEINWIGRDLEIEWFGVPGVDDIVLAEARIEEFSERLARFTVQGRTATKQELYRGTLRMLARRNGIPVGYRSERHFHAMRAALRAVLPSRDREGASSLLRLLSAPSSIPLGK